MESQSSTRSIITPCRVIFAIIILGWLLATVYADNQVDVSHSSSFDTVTPEYAEGFTVEYHDTYKIVRVLNAWRGCNETYTYVLTQNGSPIPELHEKAEIIEIPTNRFVALSTTYLSDLDILGVCDKLVGVQNIRNINTESVRSLYNKGKVREVGGSSMTSGLNLETLIDLDPDLVMTYATGNTQYDQHLKLQEAGIPVVLNAEYMESNPLGRAEWIKYISVFFNKEREANEYFNRIETEYHELAKKIQDASVTKPTVFLGYNDKGTWYMPGGNSYVAWFLRDAGAQYLWSNDTSTGSMPLDFEQVYDSVIGADYWLDPGTADSKEELLSQDPNYQDLSAFKRDLVFNDNARLNADGGNDFWESGVTHPQDVLKDLVKIFHPELLPGHSLIYYKKLE